MAHSYENPSDTETTPQPHFLLLCFIAFSSGAIVMSMELCGSRLVAPFLGSSLFVWTSLIGVILGFLSFGYWLGGRTADTKPHLLAPILLAAAGGLALVAAFEYPLLVFLSQKQLDIRLAAVIAASVLFGVPSVLLGMVTPFTARLALSALSTSGSRIGTIYAVSTLGSIVGTFLTGFYLFSLLGSSTLILILAGYCGLLAALLAGAKLRLPLSLLALCLGSIWWMQASFLELAEARGLRIRETSYHRILIVDTKEGERVKRLLITDPFGAQSTTYLDAPTDLSGDYAQYYDIGVYQTSTEGKFLMLGGGAFSYAKHFAQQFPHAKLDVVEIDPSLQSIAKEFFFLRDTPQVQIHHADARVFLRQQSEQYHAIFLDVFTSAPEVPFHVATTEFFTEVRKRLLPNGLVIINIIAAPEGLGAAFLRPLLATIDESFPHPQTFRVKQENMPQKVQNLILIGRVQAGTLRWREFPVELQELQSRELDIEPASSEYVLRDTFAPVEHYMGAVYKALERDELNAVTLQRQSDTPSSITE